MLAKAHYQSKSIQKDQKEQRPTIPFNCVCADGNNQKVAAAFNVAYILQTIPSIALLLRGGRLAEGDMGKGRKGEGER